MLYNQEEAVTMSSQATAPAKAPTKTGNVSTAVIEDEILDWDCALETPPPSQRSGQLVVTLRKIQIEPSPV